MQPYAAYDMPASTTHGALHTQITASPQNSNPNQLTFNLRRTLRAHVLIIQISNLLLLRCAKRRGIRRPCILPDNIQICIPRGRGRWRRRGAWSPAHLALLSVYLTIPIDMCLGIRGRVVGRGRRGVTVESGCRCCKAMGKAVLLRCCGELSVVVRDLEQGSVVQGWACRRFDAWDADAGLAGPRLWDDGDG